MRLALWRGRSEPGQVASDLTTPLLWPRQRTAVAVAAARRRQAGSSGVEEGGEGRREGRVRVCVDGWTALRAVGVCVVWVGGGWLHGWEQVGARGPRLGSFRRSKSFHGRVAGYGWRPHPPRPRPMHALPYARCSCIFRPAPTHGASANLSCPASADTYPYGRAWSAPTHAPRLVLSPPRARRCPDGAGAARRGPCRSGLSPRRLPARPGLSHEAGGHRASLGTLTWARLGPLVLEIEPQTDRTTVRTDGAWPPGALSVDCGLWLLH